MSCRTFFITGTDTGVGKTLLTALLISRLRERGLRAAAIKPFCSGSTEDVDLLEALQGGALSRREINPFYFPEPVAPVVSARQHRRRVSLESVVEKVWGVAEKNEVLVVEGSGGLLVPLGEGYTVLDLIRALRCEEVIVVSRNRLGTINHTLLTARALAAAGAGADKVVLMDAERADVSSGSNARILSELLRPAELVRLPYMGPGATRLSAVKKNAKKFQKTLARILRSSIVCALFFGTQTVGLKNI